MPISSKTSASAGLLNVTVDSLTLGVPYPTTLSTDQERLLQVTVPSGATLEVLLTSSGAGAANEIFIGQGSAPTDSVYTAAYSGGLAPNQMAVVPSTVPGVYYILIRGHSEPADDTPVTVLAQLLPLSINNVVTDQGGDSQYVTTTISGAQFQPNAIVKLVMPGFAEYQPLVTDFVNSTEIIAEFDLTGLLTACTTFRSSIPTARWPLPPIVSRSSRRSRPTSQSLWADRASSWPATRAHTTSRSITWVTSMRLTSNSTSACPSSPMTFPRQIPASRSSSIRSTSTFTICPISNSPPTSPARRPTRASSADVPFATLQAQADTAASNGHVQAPGYLFNEAAGGSTSFTFDVTTYPGLAALNDRNFDALKAEIYAANPAYAAEGILNDGPQGLDLISPGLYELYESFGEIPNIFTIPFVPFQFDINASATTLTRAEFVAQATAPADQLRTAILADSTAPVALQNLAADQTNWENLYLAGLEQAGVLLPDGATPPISQNPLIMSEMATLATGVLAGPAGSGIISSGNVAQFFSDLLNWYGNDPDATSPVAYYNDHGNPVATLPALSQFDLDAASPTNFEDFNVYVPWLSWESRADLPPSFQITSVQEVNGVPVIPLDLDQYIDNGGQDAGLASMTGPFTAEDDGFIPGGQPLPFTVNFQNDAQSSTMPGEIRITTQLDPSLDPSSFRLGDIQIGDIDISIPSNLAYFQGDFDFTQTKGFILSVSAGIDTQTGIATWLLEAIDPLTGEVITNPDLGLLPANDAEGDERAGYVSYTVQPYADATSGATVSATATVLFNNAAARNYRPAHLYPRQHRTDDADDRDAARHRPQLPDPVAEHRQRRWFGRRLCHDLRRRRRRLVSDLAERGHPIVRDHDLPGGSRAHAYLPRAGHRRGWKPGTASGGKQPDAPPQHRQSRCNPHCPQHNAAELRLAPVPTVQPSTNPLFTQAQKGIPNTPP